MVILMSEVLINDIDLFKLKAQTRGVCGLRCVVGVMDYHNHRSGIKKDYKKKDLAFLTQDIYKGCDPQDLVRAARQFGFNAREIDGTGKEPVENFDALKYFIRHNLPPIVDWISLKKADGHYEVAIGYDSKKKLLLLADPTDGEKHWVDIEPFLENWYDFYPRFPKNKKDFYTNNQVIISPSFEKIITPAEVRERKVMKELDRKYGCVL